MLIGESIRVARSTPVSSALLAATAAVIVAVTITTIGQTVAYEDDVLAQFQTQETHVILVDDTSSVGGLDTDSVKRVGGLSGVDWVIGLTVPVDVRIASLPAHDPTPARSVIGKSPRLQVTNENSMPGASISSTSASRLGLADVSGTLADNAGHQFGIVGSHRADGVLSDLNQFVLIDASVYPTPMRRLIIFADRPESVSGIALVLADVIGRPRHELEISTSTTLVKAGLVVSGQIGGFNRAIIPRILGFGVLLGGFISFTSVTLRRKDFGRRRALGASRTQVMFIVTVANSVAVLPGIVAGAAAGAVMLRRLGFDWPPWWLVISVGYLAFIALIGACAGPVVAASMRDPVRALRVP